MTKDRFKKIWNIIKDTADAIHNDTGGNESEVAAKLNDSQMDAVYMRYEELNKLCKKKHMAVFHSQYGKIPGSEETTKREKRIDRHKIASCIACSLLRMRPMKRAEPTESTSNLSYYANEVLAFFVALSVMKSFTKEVLDIKRKSKIETDEADVEDSSLFEIDDGILERIVEEGYKFPSRGTHDDYLLWQLIAFADISDFGNYVISLSCTLFLIEEYTIQSYQNSIQQLT